MMQAAISTLQPQVVSPVDALWSLYMSQSARVRAAFRKRVVAESNAITPALARTISEAEKHYQNGETVGFGSMEEFDAYFNAL